MIHKSRWTWGRQLQWGILLFMIFVFSNFFIYDTTVYFKSMFNLIFSIITFTIFIVSAGTNKALTKQINLTKPVLIWGSICMLVIILDMAIYNIPKNIYTVFTSRYFWTNTSYALSAAIFEESICRGLFLSSFLQIGLYKGTKLNITRSAIYSSLLFSGLHIINLSSGSANMVFQQMFSALAIGMLFVVVRIITNGLLWPILIHFILDWGPLVSYSYSGDNDWIVTIVIYTVIFLISVKTLSIFDHQIMTSSD